MLTSDSHTSTGHASHFFEPKQHSSNMPNMSVISKNMMMKQFANKAIMKTNVKKMLYSNILSNYKDDNKPFKNKTNSQDKMFDRKSPNVAKPLMNKSNSVKPTGPRKTPSRDISKQRGNLNTTRDRIKDTSYSAHSPGYSKSKSPNFPKPKPVLGRIPPKMANLSRDGSKARNQKSISKSKMLSDLSVSDHDKTIDRMSTRTPKTFQTKSLRSSKTPKTKNNLITGLKGEPYHVAKLDNSKSYLKKNNPVSQIDKKANKNDDSYLGTAKGKNVSSSIYSSFMKKWNPKKGKANILPPKELKKVSPVEKKAATLPVKELDLSKASIREEMQKMPTLKTPTMDETKEKEKFDRNMNSLINIDNVKQEHLKKGFNFKENTTSPIGKKRDSEEFGGIFTKLNSSILKNLLSDGPPSKEKSFIDKDQKIEKRIKNICDLTKMGYSSSGSKKVNQDSFFIKYNFVSPQGMYMGVCDGHGQLGHLVSGFLRENLSVALEKCIKRRFKLNSHNSNNNNLNKIIEDVFVDINNRLCNQQPFDTNFSGSTCCTVIFNPDKLICANVGDSRAVLGRCVNGEWKNIDLSRDHKPADKEEAKRIHSKGGRVEPFKDENGEFLGPSRVWLMHEDVPGLAMSRSFADQVAASVGVLCIPEIAEFPLTNDDKFFIIASDGVWEFIESAECVNIIKDYYLKDDISGAAEYLMKESTQRWLKDDDSVDDITIILVFFE